jgi:hypothetical protein
LNTKPQMSERTAAAIGRGIAEGHARALRGEVIGPWRGSPDDMLEAVEHQDPVEHQHLAGIAHQSACRRWTELVLLRASKVRASALVLGDGDAAVGLRLADGSFAWPGDRVEWSDPVTGGTDTSPWWIKGTWVGGCLLVRSHPSPLPLFGDRYIQRVVSEQGMARLMPWRCS